MIKKGTRVVVDKRKIVEDSMGIRKLNFGDSPVAKGLVVAKEEPEKGRVILLIRFDNNVGGHPALRRSELLDHTPGHFWWVELEQCEREDEYEA